MCGSAEFPAEAPGVVSRCFSKVGVDLKRSVLWAEFADGSIYLMVPGDPVALKAWVLSMPKPGVFFNCVFKRQKDYRFLKYGKFPDGLQVFYK